MERLRRKAYYTTKYKQKNNVTYAVKHKLTDSEIKAYIKKANNWTDEQYRKQYDLFKNKLRAYESFKASHGVYEKQNVIDVLYKEAKAKMKYGDEYTPSLKMQQIRKFGAYSITKGRQLAKSESYQRRQSEKYDAIVTESFSKLVEANAQARQIAEYYKDDPVKREQALKDFAEDLKLKTNEKGEIEESEAIPTSGEAHGYAELDIDDYLQY